MPRMRLRDGRAPCGGFEVPQDPLDQTKPSVLLLGASGFLRLVKRIPHCRGSVRYHCVVSPWCTRKDGRMGVLVDFGGRDGNAGALHGQKSLVPVLVRPSYVLSFYPFTTIYGALEQQHNGESECGSVPLVGFVFLYITLSTVKTTQQKICRTPSEPERARATCSRSSIDNMVPSTWDNT